MPKIAPGSIVTLRCGGPRMVVERATLPPPPDPPEMQALIPPEPFRPKWRCLWTIQGALRCFEFETAALVVVEGEAGQNLPAPGGFKHPFPKPNIRGKPGWKLGRTKE